MTRFATTKTGLLAALVLAATAIFAFALFRKSCNREGQTGMAIEFMDHAAAAYVAHDKGWYETQGLSLSSYTSYASGMALASALARRDVQIAYVCLVPAINAYANAGVPIKIVAGTHRYGYALVANPEVVARVEDLARDGLRLGCVREGSAVDVLMNRTLDKYRLSRGNVQRGARRMNPPQLLLAIESRQIDAAFLPEQWASMAEDLGFKMTLTARDVWPGMQGSVLVVKAELIRDHPEMVRTLVAVNDQATRWINAHPDEAADTLVRTLSVTGEKIMPADAATLMSKLRMSREMMLRSMRRLEYTTAISREDVQDVIDYMVKLGYIKRSFPAEEIMDTRFMP